MTTNGLLHRKGLGKDRQCALAFGLIVCLMVLGADCQYPAVVNTKGRTLAGYGPIENECKQYTRGTIVMSRILDKYTSGDVGGAKNIYANEQLTTDPFKPLKHYARARDGDWSRTSAESQKFMQKGKSYYGGKFSYVDDYFSAFDSKAKVETGLVWVSILWLFNQLDQSRYFMTTAGRGRGLTWAGPAEVDDSACLYIAFQTKTFSLWKFYSTVTKQWRAGQCNSINSRIVTNLNAMRSQAKNEVIPNFNFGNYDTSYKRILELVCVGQLRAVLWQVSKQTKQSQAYAFGYLMPCAPFFKKNADTRALNAILSRGTVASFAEVKAKVVAIAKAGTRNNDITKDVFCGAP